jgi:uncharacterized protein (DUF305 family)
MQKDSILYGVIGLLLGVMVTVFATRSAVSNNYNGMMRVMGINTANTTRESSNADSSMGMDEMRAGLNGKSGDDFDKTFLSEMIIHHQGAIDMAKEAQARAKHDEIKKLAGEIITAQTA